MDVRGRRRAKTGVSLAESQSLSSDQTATGAPTDSMNNCRAARVRAALWRWRKTELVIAVVIAIIVIAANLRPPCLWPYLALKQYPRLTSQDRTDVTLVTAYFNLGKLEREGSSLSTYKYLYWAQAFQYVMNPLVVYTDSEQIENMFLETRKHLANITRVFRVSRSSLDSFKDVEKIRQLFQDPNYPKFHPNTDIPEYPCSQHAKYELVQRTMEEGHFSWTRYVAWIDIGYFRYITQRRRPFYVSTPPGMDESKVAMTQVATPDFSLHPVDVFHGNLVWVGGGMSLATRDVYARFVHQYQRFTDSLLRQGLSSTDQQVIYAMYTEDGYNSIGNNDNNNSNNNNNNNSNSNNSNSNNSTSSSSSSSRGSSSKKKMKYNDTSRVEIQTYAWPLNDLRQCWFYLGFQCYREQD